MATVKISGLESLRRKLIQMPIEAKKEIALAMEKGAQEIVELAKTLAPIGEATGRNSSNNPGALRDSIDWKWGEPPKGTITLGKVRSGTRDSRDLYITIYAGNEEAFYARWVEFGTRAHGIDVKNAPVMKRGGVQFGTHVDHPGAIQHAFFYPAYRALKKRTKTRISRAINKSVKNVANS